MTDKKTIKEIMKKDRLPFEFIARLTNTDKADYKALEELLNEMVIRGELKYSENTGLYHVPAHQKFNKEALYQFIEERKYIYEDDAVRAFKLKYKEAKSFLNELLHEKRIAYSPILNVYGIPKVATITIKNSNYGFYGFATVLGEEADYYVSGDLLADAYNGDTALILTGPKLRSEDKLKSAVVIEVIERAHKTISGVLSVKGKKYKKYYIRSSSADFNICADVNEDDIKNINVGQIVSADIEYVGMKLLAKNLVLLGNPNDPGIEITEIAIEYGFKVPFSAETEEEIKHIPDNVLKDELDGREDYRDLSIITIDGDDSKDFDDAVYVERLNNGNYFLGVYIADVSHYVKENTALNSDALERGTSVYLADRVIPMIPHKLSDGICSLVEGEDRLVLACLMEIDEKGKLVNYDIKEGVIKSRHRMTYKKVNKILNGDKELIAEYNDIYDMLLKMDELSKIIRRIRHKKGAIDFETSEYKFTLNEDGSPKEIKKCERDDAEMLIEDFMLKANETIAYHMNIMNLPIVYRVHEKPDQEKLHTVFKMVNTLGCDNHIKDTVDITPYDIQHLLEKLDDNPNKEIINNMVLRGMMKAKYNEKCLGHYGLQMNYYCHFTSPIRRYPDLMTHRMIKKLLLHPSDKFESELNYYSALIADIANKNSISERKSVDCERAVNDMLYSWYMESKVGYEYDAVITSITQFGMFANIGMGIEGLISYRNMNGYFDFDDRTMTASNGKTTYRLGDRIKVRVIDSNRLERKIDFVLSEDYDEGYLYK
ncbi:MAG: ribonuclease R [Acholeplasmatales bacterium]|nr:ribonuclease R [Acholeplasmatales bacterium]